MAGRRTIVALMLAGALSLAACARSDPEKELRATIAQMATAIEKREPAAFLEAVAEDFTRESSAFGKQDARRLLAGLMLRNARIGITAVVSDVKIQGQRATAKVRVLATGGDGLLPERGQAWDFDTGWRLEGGQWRVFNAEWRAGLR